MYKERRAYPRFSYGENIFGANLSNRGQTNFFGEILNVGQGGLLFRSDKLFSLDSCVEIVLSMDKLASYIDIDKIMRDGSKVFASSVRTSLLPKKRDFLYGVKFFPADR